MEELATFFYLAWVFAVAILIAFAIVFCITYLVFWTLEKKAARRTRLEHFNFLEEMSHDPFDPDNPPSSKTRD